MKVYCLKHSVPTPMKIADVYVFFHSSNPDDKVYECPVCLAKVMVGER